MKHHCSHPHRKFHRIHVELNVTLVRSCMHLSIRCHLHRHNGDESLHDHQLWMEEKMKKNLLINHQYRLSSRPIKWIKSNIWNYSLTIELTYKNDASIFSFKLTAIFDLLTSHSSAERLQRLCWICACRICPSFTFIWNDRRIEIIVTERTIWCVRATRPAMEGRCYWKQEGKKLNTYESNYKTDWI